LIGVLTLTLAAPAVADDRARVVAAINGCNQAVAARDAEAACAFLAGEPRN
jgi:hypothetical protein